MIGMALAFGLLAQEPDRWSEAIVAPVFAEGRLRACAINFKAAQRDNLYFGGRYVGTDGSFNLYHFGDGKVGAMLKVAVLEGEALRLPDTGYLITGYATNAADAVSNMEADDVGYRLVAYSLGDATVDAIANFSVNSTVTVGVQMFGGTSAIPFRVDLSNDQAADWSDCVGTLINDIERVLGDTD